MNLDRPDGSFNRELAIRLMKWGMFASAFTIVLMIVGAFLGRSLVPLVGVTPNLIAIAACYFGKLHHQRKLLKEKTMGAKIAELQRNPYRSLVVEADD